MRTQTLPLTAIDTGCDDYSPSWPLLPERLAASIERQGVLQPPIVAPHGGGHVPVCGLRRLKAAERLGLGSVECRVLGAGEPAGRLLLLNVEENLLSRRLGLVERARLARRLDRAGERWRKRILDLFGPDLGLGGGARELERLAAVDALPAGVKDFLALRRAQLKQGLSFCALGPDGAARVADLALRRGLTLSQSAALADMLHEVSRRDGTPVEVLAAELEEGIESARAASGGRREVIMERARTRRFPLWSSRSKSLAHCLAAAAGIPGTSVKPPPFFEGDALRAEILFRSPRELEEALSGLGRFLRSGKAGEALRLLAE